MIPITRATVQTFCRTCLQELCERPKKHEPHHDVRVERNIIKWMLLTISQTVSDKDLCTHLCHYCYAKVRAFYEFREKAVCSGEALRQLVEENMGDTALRNLKFFCRICLKNLDNLASLQTVHGLEVRTSILECTGIDVGQLGLENPKNICNLCYKKLRSFVEFRKISKLSLLYLESVVGAVEIESPESRVAEKYGNCGKGDLRSPEGLSNFYIGELSVCCGNRATGTKSTVVYTPYSLEALCNGDALKQRVFKDADPLIPDVHSPQDIPLANGVAVSGAVNGGVGGNAAAAAGATGVVAAGATGVVAGGTAAAGGVGATVGAVNGADIGATAAVGPVTTSRLDAVTRAAAIGGATPGVGVFAKAAAIPMTAVVPGATADVGVFAKAAAIPMTAVVPGATADVSIFAKAAGISMTAVVAGATPGVGAVCTAGGGVGAADTGGQSHSLFSKRKFIWNCAECKQQFYKLINYETHIRRVHEGMERPFPCDQCPKSYRLYHYLKRHVRENHSGVQGAAAAAGPTAGARSPNAVPAAVPGANPPSAQAGCKAVQPPDAEVAATELNCPICCRTFKRKAHLTDHISSVHEGQRPYKCSFCELTFAARKTCRVHEMIHNDSRPFGCEYCQKAFRQLSELKAHLESHTAAPELLCSVCKRSSRTSTELEHHVAEHKEKMRFQCAKCGVTFKKKSQLKSHEDAVHLEEKPYKCSWCPKVFALRKTCRIHERMHTGESPEVCEICQKAFKQPSGLHKHKRIHHPQRDAPSGGVQPEDKPPQVVVEEKKNKKKKEAAK